MESKLIYLAYPYTHPDPVANTHEVIKLADRIIAMGFTPIIPHLAIMWHMVTPRPVEFWYEYDLKIMRRCDAVLRTGGESFGADREVEQARIWGIPVLFDIEDLRNSWGK